MNIESLIKTALTQAVYIDGKKLRAGVYGLLIKENRVLMTHTKSGSKFIYNFPGGAVDSNDKTLEAALIRECAEELQRDVIVKEQLFTSQKPHVHEDFPDIFSLNCYFLIEAVGEEVAPGAEVDHVAWFDINQLPLDQMLACDKEFALFYF